MTALSLFIGAIVLLGLGIFAGADALGGWSLGYRSKGAIGAAAVVAVVALVAAVGLLVRLVGGGS